MVRKKPKPEDSGGDRKHFVGLTPNQVVAYNVAKAWLPGIGSPWRRDPCSTHRQNRAASSGEFQDDGIHREAVALARMDL